MTSMLLFITMLPGILDHDVAKLFESREHQFTGGPFVDETLNYRLFVPETLDPNKKYPLLLWLHGLGESGRDNEIQLFHMQHLFRDTKELSKYPFFVLVPQSPKREHFDMMAKVAENGSAAGKEVPIFPAIAIDILDKTIREYPIDEDRVYLLGISAGGTAAWKMVLNYPDRFAAVSPISSGGMSDFSNLDRFRNTPVWAFNCAHDSGTPVEKVHRTVSQLGQSGNVVCLTEIDSSAHDSWTAALRDYKVVDWMLGQKRGSRCWTKPGGKPWKASEIAMQSGLVAFIALIVFAVWRQKRTKQTGQPAKTNTEPADHD